MDAVSKTLVFGGFSNVCGRVRTDANGSMAGAPGFEPGNGGIKIRCLTTWLRPNDLRMTKFRISGHRLTASPECGPVVRKHVTHIGNGLKGLYSKPPARLPRVRLTSRVFHPKLPL
jgi:hypothetical protein